MGRRESVCSLCSSGSWIAERENDEWADIDCEACGSYRLLTDEPLDYLEGAADGQRSILTLLVRRLHEDGGRFPLSAENAALFTHTYTLATAACEQFGLRNSQLRHSRGWEYVTPLYIVDTDGGRFTVRIYGNDISFNGALSELLWLRSVRESAGIEVPNPADSVEGPWLQTVHAEGDARNCAVFPWIPGVRLEDVPAEQRTRALIETFGEFLAKMHNASEQFEAPPWFDRHRYGAEEFRRDMAANLAEEDFPAESERELREAGLRRLQLMEELGEGKDVFGLVQPDLSARNVLANGGDIACVDFYELGYGHYLMDLVQALHRTVNEGEREAVLDGYQRARPLPDRFEERRKIIREARAFPRGWWMVS